MAGRTGQLSQAARFTARLYGGRARGASTCTCGATSSRGWLGAADPYPIYERIRAAGPFVRTPSGHLASADHAICKQVLRDRRFGVEPEGTTSRDPARDRSFLTQNPPDHTRLRRIVAPALSARRLADFTRCSK